MNESKDKPEVLSQVEHLQKMLSEAIDYGYQISFSEKFALSFSPMDILLDCTIDIILLMRKMFDFGASAQRNTAGIGFSDRYQDVLGNPKQFKITTPSKYYWDPKAADIFMQLAQTFIEIKRQKPVKKSFMDFLDRIDVRPRPQPRGRDSKKKRAVYHWWRRQKRHKSRLTKN
jgi:hypothetical protein